MKPKYVVKEYTINAKNINNFVLADPRRIRNKQIKSLLRALELKEHFESGLVVNSINKTIRVIDGSHRITALRIFLESHPEETIDVFLYMYVNLTIEEEREIYTKWNISIRQNTHDFIHSYRETIPIYNKLMKALPITIYGSKNRLRIKNVCEAYFASRPKIFSGGISWTNMQFVKKMQELDEYDANQMIETFEIMQNSFNPHSYTDIATMIPFKTTPFIALSALIQRNKSNLGKHFIQKQMKRSLNKYEILKDQNRGGHKACIQAYAIYKAILNSFIEDETKHFT